ncbi:hypothetical protein ACFSSA_01885 [Luteolibacter algae]|uniref:Uncharacterized protein n=2 Tax=Luteolibacter algae TaxID=454151 RepID=A0ABW5D4V0_9BACT
MERKTARAYSNSTRAEMALESGLELALSEIAEIARHDDSIVFRIEDQELPEVGSPSRPRGDRERFFTFGAVYEDGHWKCVPLFSGGDEMLLGERKIEALRLAESLEDISRESVTLAAPSVHDQYVPRAKWVDISEVGEKEQRLRYAFWVEDLSGRIDSRAIRINTTASVIDEPTIDIRTILEPGHAPEAGLPEGLILKNKELRTSGSLRTLLEKESAARIEPYVHYCRHSERGIQLIPHGFGYAAAGTEPADLNELIEAGAVDELAEYIAEQLPEFESRKGGFPEDENYLKTLCASMIDYADADSDASVGEGYRGVDSYPFVNEMYDRYEITSQSDEATEISVETYIELWNPCQLDIAGTIEFTNINKMRFKMPPGVYHQFSNASFPAIEIELPANGFGVIYLGKKEYSFPHSFGIPARLEFTAFSGNNFELKWNGRVVDRARRGVQRPSGFLDAAPSPGGNDEFTYNWKGNASPAHNLNESQFGDPRANYYVDSAIRNHNYRRSNWGGRSVKTGIQTAHTYEVKLTDWPDKGSSSLSGILPDNDKVRPAASPGEISGTLDDGTPFPVTQPEMAPAFISNSGRYDSVAELGNIFDPAQWSDVEDPDLKQAEKKAGGGQTLAIGRPEFAAFDQDGWRAAQLLDIFSVTHPSGDRHFPVNINTAPREVLRALVSGVLEADPANPDLEAPSDIETGDVFADYVIAQRQIFPLRSFSDLNQIRSHPLKAENEDDEALIPFFGSREAYPQTKAPSETWDDAGREELFRKVMERVGFGSKIFRVIVAGEVLSESGKVVGRATREYHVSVESTRDVDGVVLPDQPVRFIKHYEKSH